MQSAKQPALLPPQQQQQQHQGSDRLLCWGCSCCSQLLTVPLVRLEMTAHQQLLPPAAAAGVEELLALLQLCLSLQLVSC
jgi:hypothetical protein